ncbi:MAG: isopentenyl-diphosphate Delta-isomerase [Parcubacteria group bacterium]|nr:isopentenyl-diphosphate Delta-isomerase [Parcubacteria group bacterium]
MKEQIILVDEKDNEIGIMEKLEAHKKGLLHRAFSICVFNNKGEMLLQKRASHKYHSGGLWTNTCCSHPRPGESVLKAAKRRLKEEMGIQCELKEVGSFIYKVPFENGLTEYEYDYILIGTYQNDPILNKEEVEDFKWVDLKNLKKDMEKNPRMYTFWFKTLVSRSLLPEKIKGNLYENENNNDKLKKISPLR